LFYYVWAINLKWYNVILITLAHTESNSIRLEEISFVILFQFVLELEFS